MMKIIIINRNPLLERLKKDLLIDEFIKEGYKVEYWDLHSFLGDSKKFIDQLYEPYIRYFKSLADVEDKIVDINKNKTIFFIQFLPTTSKTKSLFKLLKKNKFYLVQIDLYPQPFLVSLFSKYNISLLFSRNIIKFFKRHFRALLQILFFKNSIYNIFDTYFSCSSLHKNIIKINSADYNNYLLIKNNKCRIISDKYILFIDIFLFLHPETKSNDIALNSKLSVGYHQVMKDFFDWLEMKFNMQVVIAAHPSSIYNQNEFGNRKIIKYKTGELVKDAEIVITHNSTSNVYPILFDKPIVFVRTDQMKYLELSYQRMASLAHFFGKKIYDISSKQYNNIEF